MADMMMDETARSHEILRGILNRERQDEIREGNGMRKAFQRAEAALAAYDKAKEERRAADAIQLDVDRKARVEEEWSNFRKLEDDWGFDQLPRLQNSLDGAARKPHFDVRRRLYPPLREAVQSVEDRLARLQTLKEGFRGPAEDAWQILNGRDGVWETADAIEKAGGLPGSWLFRGPIIGVLNAEAKKRAKAANEAAKAAVAEGQPVPSTPAKVKAVEYAWEEVVHDETYFQMALPQDEAAVATRERLTAQLWLAVRLDTLGLKVEALYSAYKAEKFNSGLTEAEVALIVERFQKMEAPKEERTAPSPEALAAAELLATGHPDPAALQAAAADGDPIAQALVNLDERENGKDAPVPADGPLSLDDPRFRGFVTMKAEEAGESFEDYKSLLSSRPADARAIEAEYRASLNGGNGTEPKTEGPKRKARIDGKAKAEEKNGKPARRGLFSRKLATAEEE